MKDNLINISLDDPIEIGVKLDLGVPNWDIILIMLNDYILTDNEQTRNALISALNNYELFKIGSEQFEESMSVIVDASIIRAIVVPDDRPTYKQAISYIRESILKYYIGMTKKSKHDKSLLKDFISMTIEPIAFNLYNIYNMEEYNKYVERVNKLMETRASYIQAYKDAKTPDKRLEIQTQMTLWERKENRDYFIEEYREETYRQYNTEKEINYVLSELIKELNIDDAIEKLDSIIPISYIMANNKMMNKLSSGELQEGLTELLVIDRKKKEVVTPISLNYDDENIQIANKEKRFTAYDRAVHNSVCSIFEVGNTTFTPDQVYRCMNGLNNTEKVSPQSIGAVTKSIDKTRRMYTKIEVEKEAKEYGVDKIIMEDYILTARKITVEAGGHDVMGYKFNYSNNSKPIIYEYAQITGQVLTIPRELLNTKDVIRSTTEVTIIREYLIRRIEVMKRKGNKHQSNKIRFTSIYQEIGQDDPTKQKAQRVRENIEKLLGSFKDNDYIKGYKFYKEGRSFKGIEILY